MPKIKFKFEFVLIEITWLDMVGLWNSIVAWASSLCSGRTAKRTGWKPVPHWICSPPPVAMARLKKPKGKAVRDLRESSRTRQRLLEVAGQLFAEKGFDRVTSKEICRRAKANIAAVNYHFGGIDGLHAAVLQMAHGQIFSLQAVADVMSESADPQAKLRALMTMMVQAMTQPQTAWAVRVMTREMASPSPALDVLRESEIVPKARLIRHLIAELMGVPADDSRVPRACISVMGPCFMLLTGDRRVMQSAMPDLNLTPKHATELVEHLVRFAVAGLKAVSS